MESRDQACLTWGGVSDGLRWSPEGVLSWDEAVGGHGGGGGAAQLRGGEADLTADGARTREAERKVLARGVHGVPRGRVHDPGDVMLKPGEVIRRREVLSVQGQRLGRVPDGLGAGVHTCELARQVRGRGGGGSLR